MTKKRSLVVLSGPASTEVLVEPARASARGGGPRQRVFDRVKELTRNAALLASAIAPLSGCGVVHGTTTALGPIPAGTGGGGSGGSGGTGGTAGSGHAGSGGFAGTPYISDPLPFPAGTGGGSGTAGYGGCGSPYGACDPVAPPFLCPPAAVFDAEVIGSTTVRWDHFAIVISVQLNATNYDGSTYLSTVRQSSRAVQTIQSTSPVMVRLELGSGAWPSTIDVDLGFVCKGWSDAPQYQYQLRLLTGTPAADGGITYQVLGGDADAGTAM